MPPTNALPIFQGEMSVVVAGVRRALRYRTSEMPQDPLLKKFSTLKARLSGLEDITVVPLQELLDPFLDVIGARLVGSATDLALLALKKFLDQCIIDPHIAEARQGAESIAHAVTNASFSATDKDSDSVVFMRIVDVLRILVKSELGNLLSSESIVVIVQTCREIALEESLSVLLRRTTEQCLLDIVVHLFSRIPELDPDRLGAPEEAHLDISGRSTHLVASQLEHAIEPARPQSVTSDIADDSVDQQENNGQVNPHPEDGTASDTTAHLPAEQHQQHQHQQTSELNSPPSQRTNSRGVRFQHGDDGPVVDMMPYGLGCISELLRFLVSFIDAEDTYFSSQQQALGLTLITAVIETSAPEFRGRAAFIEIVEDSLCRVLFGLLSGRSADTTAAVLRILFLIFQAHSDVLKFQLAKFLEILFKTTDDDYQKLDSVLECIHRLCQLPGFSTCLFINFDCSVYCPDLLETMLNFLAQQACPTNINLCTTHLSAMESLLAIVKQISAKQLNSPSSDSGAYSSKQEIATIKDRKKILDEAMLNFNDKPASGIEYLRSKDMLQTPLVASEVAKFLREHPFLDKEKIGEYIGKSKPFNLEVLKEFVESFDFSQKEIDEALREFLTAFRLPGEAQIIDRIVESFASHWFETYEGQRVPKTKDSAYILAYSIIMLNVDQHNPKNKRRMKVKDFIKNLRGQNSREDFPPEYLTGIFNNISKNEIVLPDEHDGHLKESFEWNLMLDRSRRPGSVMRPAPLHLEYDRAVFSLLWAKCITSLSAVFETTHDPAMLAFVLDGFRSCAEVAARFDMPPVFDKIVVTLCSRAGFNMNNPDVTPSNLDEMLTWHYGVNQPARMAAATVFELARVHGDVVREGWRDLLELVRQFLLAKLLPKELLTLHDFTSREGVYLFSNERRPTSRSEGFFYRLFFSADTGTSTIDEQDVPMRQTALESVGKCHVPLLFSESRTLTGSSLAALCQNLVYFSKVFLDPESSTDEATAAPILSDPQRESCCIFFLEMLCNVLLWNRDRAEDLWPPIGEYLLSLLRLSSRQFEGAAVMPTTPPPTPSIPHSAFMTERGVVCVFRAASRLLTRESMVTAMTPAIKAATEAADETAGRRIVNQIAASINSLIVSRGTLLRSSPLLQLVFRGLARAREDPNAMHRALDAISCMLKTVEIRNLEYQAQLVDMVLEFAGVVASNAEFDQVLNESVHPPSRSPSQAESVSLAIKLLDIMQNLHVSVMAAYRASVGDEEINALPMPDVWRKYWEPLLKGMSAFCTDRRRNVRQEALSSLQRSLLLPDLEEVTANEWMLCFENIIFPLLSRLLEADTDVPPYFDQALDEMRMRACGLLSKVFLQHLSALRNLPSFGTLWSKVLDYMQRYLKIQHSELLPEGVPENLKNMLLVMSTTGIFQGSSDVQGASGTVLWDMTWVKVGAVLPELLKEIFPDRAPPSSAVSAEEFAAAVRSEPVPVGSPTSVEGTSVRVSVVDNQPSNDAESQSVEDPGSSDDNDSPTSANGQDHLPKRRDDDQGGNGGGGDGGSASSGTSGSSVALHPHPIIV